MTTILLDETDRSRRLVQHGAVVAGIAVLLAARVIVDGPGGRAGALAAIAVGLLLFVVAAVVKQRWSVRYKEHDIRFENNPMTGEKLFVDGVQMAKGQLGFKSRMEAKLPSGDRLVVIGDAGFLSFRCRIGVES